MNRRDRKWFKEGREERKGEGEGKRTIRGEIGLRERERVVKRKQERNEQ